MYDTLDRERRLVIGSSDTGQNSGEEHEPPDSTTHEPQPSETVHIHYFPDAIVICKEEQDNPQEDTIVETTLAKAKQPPVFLAYAMCTFYLLLILSCIAFQVYEILNPPIATVTIVPQSQTRTFTGTLQLGRLVRPLTISQSQTVPTTGKGHQAAREARGTVTFYNGQQTAQTVASGTVFTGGSGVSIQTSQRATIPPGNPSTGYGTVTITAQALQAGRRGNIQAGDVNTPIALAVFVKNNQFTGGQDEREFQTVAQTDIEQVATPLKTAVGQSMRGALQGQVSPTEQLFTLPCRPTQTSDHRIGEEARAVKITVSETCSAVAYNSQELETKATDLLSHQSVTKPGAGYSLIGDVQVSVREASVTHATTPLVFLSFHAQGSWVYGLTHTAQEQIKHMIAGKTTHVALQLLLSLPGVERASLRFTGFGDAARLPKNTQNIHFVLLIV